MRLQPVVVVLKQGTHILGCYIAYCSLAIQQLSCKTLYAESQRSGNGARFIVTYNICTGWPNSSLHFLPRRSCGCSATAAEETC